MATTAIADLTIGDRLYHRTRDEYGTYLGPDDADPTGATIWVAFDGDDDEGLMVSTHLIERV